MAQLVKNPPAMQETQEMQIRSQGWEDPLEEEGNPLQYSCLGHLMTRGFWQATVPRVAKSQTRPSIHANTGTHAHTVKEFMKLTSAIGTQTLRPLRLSGQ